MAGRKPLTVAFVRSVQHSGRSTGIEWHIDGMGHGLMLAVKPAHSKSWVQRIVVQGKRRNAGLGGYPLVTLAEARDAAFANRRIARRGGNPFEGHRKPVVPTFAQAASKVVAAQAGAWKDTGRSRHQWESSLAKYAFPTLGDMSLAAIATSDVMTVLTPIWSSKRVTASRVRLRISAVMKWGIAHGYRTDDPAGAAVLQALPKGVGTARRHHLALPYAEVGGAVRRVRESGGWLGTKLAFEFLVLTAARSGEVRGARWPEIDGDSWTIPAERMKAKVEHRVPLSPRAQAIIAEARDIPRTAAARQLVFPGLRGRALADATISKLLREIGIGAVPHGFRSSFRDWAAECTDTPHAVMEAALAHTIKNRSEAAYARSDLLAKRRELMDAWADYVVKADGEGAAV